MNPYKAQSRLLEHMESDPCDDDWPTNIDDIPPPSTSQLHDEYENPPSELPHRLMRPSLRTQWPRHQSSGIVISNHSIPRSLQRIITSRNKLPFSGPTLSFHNIHYSVNSRRWYFVGKAESQPILKGVSAIMRPGINAIIGPSGSGKTTLLDILSGKKDSSGVVLVDGQKQHQNFRFKSGYVVQHDLITSTLTVKENISFSAFVRLSADTTAEERKKRVHEVLTKMNLEDCEDTRIGDELIRGVSGGERKRTSIGMEMVTNPSILFLDEPTTGLDAATALRVMRVLRNISTADHKIVIMSIHQPRYSIYKLIDQLTLLSKGEIVYHGKRSEATSYFKNNGFERDPEDNPADFLLDTIILNEVASELDNIPENYAATSLPQRFKNSREGKRLYGNLDGLFRMQPHFDADSKPTFATSGFRQFQGLSIRNLKNLIRHPQAALTLSIIMTILALVVGTIFFNRTKEANGLKDRFGSFFFSILVMNYLNLAAMELFIQQRAVFIHEKESGFYRVSAYFFAKLLCDLLPMTLIPVPIYCTITYWMIGLRSEIERFLMYTLALVLLNFTVGSLALAIGAAVGIFSVANPIYVMILVISMVFSGFLISLNSIVSVLSWIQYLSFFKYCINILAVNEFEDQIYCFRDNTTTCLPTLTVDGNKFLKDEGYLEYNIWYNHLGLVLHGVFYLILAYVFLRTLRKR